MSKRIKEIAYLEVQTEDGWVPWTKIELPEGATWTNFLIDLKPVTRARIEKVEYQSDEG